MQPWWKHPVIMLIVGLLVLAGCRSTLSEKAPPAISKGVLDLRGWDFETDGIVNLKGEWEFYWDELLQPSDFKEKSHLSADPVYFNLPGLWTDIDLPAHGFATFRLSVRLDQRPQLLSLKLQDVYAAYTVFVNGRKIGNSGITGTSRTSSKDQIIPQVIDLPETNQTGQMEILFQVSNFSMLYSGSPQIIKLGEKKQIHRLRERNLASDLFLIGSILIMALYHLGLFIQKRENRSALYFSIFSFGTIVYTMITGESFLYFLFPDIDVIDLFKILLLSIFSIVLFFSMFMNAVFPDEYAFKLVRINQIFLGTGALVVIFAPPAIFLHTHFPAHIFTVLTLSYAIYALIKAAYRKRIGAFSMLLGFAFWFLTVINDILYYYLIIESINLIPVGLFVFIFSQAFLLSLRFNSSFNLVETLSGQLEVNNRDLSRLHRIKDEFLSNTSHELRTPLNGIIGLAQSLMDGIGGKMSESALKNLSLIVSSGRRLSSLVNDILDFSMLNNREVTLHRKKVDIRQQVDIVLTFVRPLVENKPVELEDRIPEDIPLVFADENRLEQILFNLVGNAIKFTESGSISVTAERQGEQLEISVMDTGIGIPEEKQADIFNSFEQVDSSSDRSYGGSGLGLSITKNLVELHGGQIMVKSDPGVGSVFSFTIPVYSESLESTTTDLILQPTPPNRQLELLESNRYFPNVPSQPDQEIIQPHLPIPTEGRQDLDLTNISILAVDDDPINLQVIINYLSLAGAKITTAQSGSECLDRLPELKPDIVLLDIMMPDMNGYRTAEKIRQSSAVEELPIIFLTAKNQSVDLMSGFTFGGNDYITKPFSRDELITRIKFHQKLVESRKKLEKAERKYRQIYEYAVEGIFQARQDGTILDMNPSMASIFGYESKERMISANVKIQTLLTDPEERQAVGAILAGKIHDLDFDAWFNRKSDSKFWGSTFMRIVKHQPDEDVYLEGIVLDMSDRRKREIAERKREIAEEANRAKTDFLTNITHELKTPLQGILGYSRIGSGRIGKVSNDKLNEFFQNIFASGQRLLKLVNDLLDLSKLEQQRMEYTFQKERLSNITSYVIKDLITIIQDKNLTIDFNQQEFVDLAEMDITRITQVIINLFSNAIKFSHPGGKIRIQLDDHPHELTFSIIDNGIGIPEGEMETVFEKFNQSSKTKSMGGGTGLGLAISRQIILDHSGEIWVEQNPDGGTIFRFQIPKTQPLPDNQN
ncbi:response regulator [bacterium]|nr:response regulator [bacterium]